jgi:hypothetical protein
VVLFTTSSSTLDKTFSESKKVELLSLSWNRLIAYNFLWKAITLEQGKSFI